METVIAEEGAVEGSYVCYCINEVLHTVIATAQERNHDPKIVLSMEGALWDTDDSKIWINSGCIGALIKNEFGSPPAPGLTNSFLIRILKVSNIWIFLQFFFFDLH